MKRLAAILLFLGAVASPVHAAELKETRWTGRILSFESRTNTIQLPMRNPTVFSAEGEPVPPLATFGRRARIAGIITEDSATYLVVDMLDTNERLYFYYGGVFSGDLPYPPNGTRLLGGESPHAVAPNGTHAGSSAKPKGRGRSAKRKNGETASATPQAPTSDTGEATIIFLAIVGLVLWLLRWESNRQSAIVAVEQSPKSRQDLGSLGLRITVSTGMGSSGYGYRVTDSNGDKFWKPALESVKVAGFDMAGMVYSGSGLGSIGAGGPEPALIDPKLPVAKGIDDCSERRLSYWPSYAGASPDARAAYLRWHATGRQDPEADAGYVFLFFYGLERRALHDVKTSEQAKAEIPAIEKEIERLLAIYQNRSFQHYAGSFLEYIGWARKLSDKLYKNPPPKLPGRYLTFSHRVGLAQCSADDQPLPAEWAYDWLIGDISTRLRTPARRCPEEFKKVFIHEYRREFGDGMKLPRNKTQLRLDYRPASASFGMNRSGLGVKLDLPDVSTLSTTVKKLQAIAEGCYPYLESYSRAVGKDKARAGSFEATLQLPPSLWPESPRKSLDLARSLVDKSGGFALLRFSELRAWFPDWKEVGRDGFEAICRALGGSGVGIEPDTRFGGTLPTDSSQIVLFAAEANAANAPTDSRYSVASLTLHLAVAVAWADGSVPEAEQTFILKQLQGWLDFSAAERARLNALTRRLLAEPPKLTGLKTRIAELTKNAKESLGQFLALVAQADHQVTPAEVKTLEKIFKLLGLDAKMVYSNVHAAASEPISVRPADPTAKQYKIPKAPADGAKSIKIDPAKVAALKADSERVSAILSSIFADQHPQPPAPAPQPVEKEQEPARDSLLGLDADHSAFLRVLAARAQWSRSELMEISQDHGLLIDGAMEHINDAAYQKFDKPFFEGEDPIDLNADILKEITDDTHQAA